MSRVVRGYYGHYRPIVQNTLYVMFLGSAFFSLAGDLMATVAAIWMLTIKTSTPALFVTASIVGTRGAFALSAPLMGGLLDRHGPLRMLVWSTGLRTAMMAGLALVIGQPQRGLLPWLVVALLSADYALAPVARNGEFMLIQVLVPDEHLTAANAAQGIQFDLAFIVGPVLGGIVTSAFGVQAAVVLNIVSFFLYAVMLGRLARLGTLASGHAAQQESQGPEKQRPSFLPALQAGFHFIWHTPPLPWLLALGFLWNLLLFGPIEVLYPVLAQIAFRADALGYGLLTAANSAGFILGLAIAGGVNWRRPLAMLFSLALVAHGLVFVVVGITPAIAVAAAMIFVGGVLTAPTDIFSKLIRQRMVPRHLQGRVSSAGASLSFVGAPLGACAAGAAIGLLGGHAAPVVLTGFGAMLAISAGLIALRRELRLV